VTLQNSQLNLVLPAQQNPQAAIHSLQGDGYYNPLENTRIPHGTTSQRNIIPTGQFQGPYTPGIKSAINFCMQFYSNLA
jgi:hypothetical protein